MPGISLIKGEFGRKKLEAEIAIQSTEVILNALELAIHNIRYTKKILFEKDSLLVVFTGYPEYPLEIIENDQFWICIEGKIYGKDSGLLRKELDVLLKVIFFSFESATSRSDNTIERWFTTTDGEFIIYALNKKNNDFVIINDALGRLPLYYHYNEECSNILISREISTMAFLIWEYTQRTIDNKLDKLAMAEYLLFGFILGDRTLVADVNRLKPASVVRWDNNDKKITVSNLFSFNFENKKHANKETRINVEKLIKLFSEACKNRATTNGKNNNNIVSLSGGFDSRCVAASLYGNNVPFSAITYVQPGWAPVLGTSTEADVAKHLANIFQCAIMDYGYTEPLAADFLKLLKIKFGLNYLEFSYMIPILEKISKKCRGSETTFFTGDGGDRLLPGLKPSKKLNNLEDLLDYILNRFGGKFFSKDIVAAITQISTDQIKNELRSILNSFPEKSFDQKFVHFMLYEAVFNDLFESEDRNRTYFWSVSPYYSVPFFDYAMGCPDSVKSNALLQKKFVSTLSPLAAAVSKAEYDCSILSKRYNFIELIISLKQKYPTLLEFIRKIRRDKAKRNDPKIIKCLQDQIRECEPVGSYFALDNLDYILDNSYRYNASGISVLFTITSLIETSLCSQSTIEKYF